MTTRALRLCLAPMSLALCCLAWDPNFEMNEYEMHIPYQSYPPRSFGEPFYESPDEGYRQPPKLSSEATTTTEKINTFDRDGSISDAFPISRPSSTTRRPDIPNTSTFPPLINNPDSNMPNRRPTDTTTTTITRVSPPPTLSSARDETPNSLSQSAVNKCDWAAINCCSKDSRDINQICFERLECPGPFWGRGPCESEFVRGALDYAMRPNIPNTSTFPPLVHNSDPNMPNHRPISRRTTTTKTRRPKVLTTSTFPPVVHNPDPNMPNRRPIATTTTTITTVLPLAALSSARDETETKRLSQPSENQCVWAIMNCCSEDSRYMNHACFEKLGCPSQYLDRNPCEIEFDRDESYYDS